MTRIARIFSPTGYMHLIIRGIGHQILFEAREDYHFFLKLLAKISTDEKVSVLAYCLMENHVHLLVFDPSGNTSKMMARLETTYAIFFNKKYNRTGHLFQNRFLNENIYTDGQLLIVFRYILNNPAKAGICPADTYEWSSFHQYDNDKSFVDTSFLKSVIGSYQSYLTFMKEANTDSCLEIETTPHNDEWAKSKIATVLQIKRGIELQQMNKAERDQALRVLKQQGLSIRQIERLTGISKSVVSRA